MIGILLGVAVVAGAVFGAAGVAAVALACLAGLQAGWLRPVSGVLLLAACLAGFARTEGQATALEPPSWAGRVHAFYATVANSPASDESHLHFITDLRPASRSVSGSARACVTAPILPNVGRGDRLYFTGDIVTVQDASPSFAAFLERSGCSLAITTYGVQPLSRGSGVFAMLDRLRQRMSARMRLAIPGDAGALASGLATGDDSALSKSARNAFYLTGASHITAVSGSNLALFMGFFAAAGAAAGWLRRLAWQLLTLGAIWTYIVLIGLNPPAFRAGMVATFAIAAIRTGRKPDLMTIGALVAAAEILIRPEDARTLSFRLSTAAAFGLLLALGGGYPSSIRQWIWKAAASSGAANLATAPVLLATVGLPFPARAIVANLAIAPVVDALFPLSLLVSLAGALDGSLALALAPPVEGMSRACLAIIDWCARLPGPTLPPDALAVNQWAWAALVIGSFCLVSAELRGGILRLNRRWLSVSSSSMRAVAAMLAAAAAGALFAWLTR